jgi:hypothetical protein
MKILNMIKFAACRSKLVVGKYSPEILIVAGVASVVGATVLACKATLKAKEYVETAVEDIEKIDELAKHPDVDYPEITINQDKKIVYTRTGFQVIRTYAPAATLLVGGIVCIFGSLGILKKRNAAIVAAYKAIEESFYKYRESVKKEVGEDADLRFSRGVTMEKDILGNDVVTVNPNNVSKYARFFDESNYNWSEQSEYNFAFIKAQEEYANWLLTSRGHLFLNEVYDLLDLPHTKEGAVVGWIRDSKHDGYVDFGMWNSGREAVRDFVNGYEPSILLDFNVDGIIYDLI